MSKFCSNCGSEVNENADVCLKCGKALRNDSINKNSTAKKNNFSIGRIFLGVLIGIVIIIIIANSSGGTNSSNTEEQFNYEITNQYADDYNVSYYIEGSVKNNKDKDYSYVQIEFVCYDDKGNNLGTAIDNTNNLLGNQTWKFKAMTLFTDVANVDHCNYHKITGW